MKNENHFMTVPAMAEKLAKSERWIWTLIKKGLIPKYKLGGSTFVKYEDFENAAEKQLAA